MTRYACALFAALLVSAGCTEPLERGYRARALAIDAAPGAVCGNGMVEAGEECDDGNTTNGDGCSAECRYEYCGDGIVQTSLGEECDDGNYRNDDGCDMYCQIERYPGPDAG